MRMGRASDRARVSGVDVDRLAEGPASSMRGLARWLRVLIRALAVVAAVATLHGIIQVFICALRGAGGRRLALSRIRLPRGSTRGAPAPRSRWRCA
jgi:hypothetical protein